MYTKLYFYFVFQATLGNIRELKLGLDNFETMEIANFSAALTRAFELLEMYRNNSGGANCNQVRFDWSNFVIGGLYYF